MSGEEKELRCDHEYFNQKDVLWPESAKKCCDCESNTWTILSITNRELRLMCTVCHHKEYWQAGLSGYGGQKISSVKAPSEPSSGRVIID